tara:strand:- start:2376 stop:2810 length:435 start_codon:yes stop_codon:yes gene_type:complete
MRIRSLQSSDYTTYLSFLRNFRPIAHYINQSQFDFVLQKVQDNGRLWVCVDPNNNDLIIGTITVHVEQKFIHDLSLYARIEDLFVLSEYRNKGIATKLIEHAIKYCKDYKVRKVSLTCQKDLVSFYQKRGFAHDTQTDLSLILS